MSLLPLLSGSESSVAFVPSAGPVAAVARGRPGAGAQRGFHGVRGRHVAVDTGDENPFFFSLSVIFCPESISGIHVHTVHAGGMVSYSQVSQLPAIHDTQHTRHGHSW